MISLVIWTFALALIPLTLGIISTLMAATATPIAPPLKVDGGQGDRARRVLPRARIARVMSPRRRRPARASRTRAFSAICA